MKCTIRYIEYRYTPASCKAAGHAKCRRFIAGVQSLASDATHVSLSPDISVAAEQCDLSVRHSPTHFTSSSPSGSLFRCCPSIRFCWPCVTFDLGIGAFPFLQLILFHHLAFLLHLCASYHIARFSHSLPTTACIPSSLAHNTIEKSGVIISQTNAAARWADVPAQRHAISLHCGCLLKLLYRLYALAKEGIPHTNFNFLACEILPSTPILSTLLRLHHFRMYICTCKHDFVMICLLWYACLVLPSCVFCEPQMNEETN